MVFIALELQEQVILQDHPETNSIAQLRILAILIQILPEIVFPFGSLQLDFKQSLQANQVLVDLYLNFKVLGMYFVIFNNQFRSELLLAILKGYFQSIQGYCFDHNRISFPRATLIQPPPLHPYRIVRHHLCKITQAPTPHHHSCLVANHRIVLETSYLLTGVQVNRLLPAHTLNEKPHPTANRSFQSKDCSLHSLLQP